MLALSWSNPQVCRCENQDPEHLQVISRSPSPFSPFIQPVMHSVLTESQPRPAARERPVSKTQPLPSRLAGYQGKEMRKWVWEGSVTKGEIQKL